MEALVTGHSFHLCPVFWKNGVALSGEALRAARLAWVADWQRILSSTDDEAAESYRKNVLEKQTRIAGGKIFSRITNGQEAVMSDEQKAIATVPARGGGAFTLTDLLGKRIKKWHGEKGEISIIHTVTNENWQWLVDICAERRLNIEVLPN
jgi:CRISPR/Cas system-associated protein endoribonuclease Cas2